MECKHDIVGGIQNSYDARSRRAGRLVCVYRIFYLHHAVALSDTHAVAWHPERKNALRDQGVFRIERLTRGYRDVEVHASRSTAEVFEALRISPAAFHLRWDYCLRSWNCEHWARLVTSGSPHSWQAKDASFGLAKMLGGVRQDFQMAGTRVGLN